MGKIRLSKYGLPQRSHGNGYSSIRVVSNQVTGFVPLLKLIDVYTGSNDYFNVKRGIMTRNSAVGRIYFESGLLPLSFYVNMRRGTGGLRTITNSMLSVLGMKDKYNEVFSQGERRSSYGNDEQKIIVRNPIDVFILAVIKASDFSKVRIVNQMFEIDSSLITLFISEEKYQNRAYLDENYNKTVAKYLRKSVLETVRNHEMKTEVVSDEVLKQYYKSVFTIENNSVFELMEIDKQIKERVLSNVNSKLMVHI